MFCVGEGCFMGGTPEEGMLRAPNIFPTSQKASPASLPPAVSSK